MVAPTVEKFLSQKQLAREGGDLYMQYRIALGELEDSLAGLVSEGEEDAPFLYLGQGPAWPAPSSPTSSQVVNTQSRPGKTFCA